VDWEVAFDYVFQEYILANIVIIPHPCGDRGERIDKRPIMDKKVLQLVYKTKKNMKVEGNK